MIQKSCQIDEEQQEWLKEHPEINFSALVRQAIERKQKEMESDRVI